VLLLLGGLLVAVAACALASRLLGALPLFGGPLAAGTPVRITALPTPVITRPQWTSYTYTGPINDLALSNGLLWAATDGGLVVWDGTGASVRFAAEHGLAGNRVTSVAVGADGAIWAGTRSGLSRYDGRAWQTFTITAGLPDDRVNDVVVDRDGYVWAGTVAGLARYDGETWRTYGRNTLFSRPMGDEVHALAVDSNNRLWAATAVGLSRLVGERWTTLTTADGLPDSPIYRLALGPDDVVWGATDLGLVRVAEPAIDLFAPGLTLAEQQNIRQIKGLAVADDGTVYSAYAFDGSVERLEPLSGNRDIIAAGPRPPGGAFSGALLFDPGGALWAGVGDTARRLAGGEWSVLAGPSDFPANAVTDMAHDGRALWLASVVGLSRFDGRWQSFGVADGLPTTDTRALAVAPDGALWAAFDTPLRGLARYGPDGWQTITCPTAAPTSAQINGAAQTAGALWFATATGVSRTDGAAWQTFDRRDGLPADAVNDVAAQGETVWAATSDGIARYDGQWRVVSGAAATHLAVAPGGAIWAYDGRAVFRVDADGTRAALPLPTTVRGLAATDDALWLATPDGALRYNGVWTVFTADEGLPTVNVTAIGAGDDGRMWAATSGDVGQIDIVVFDGRRWAAHPNRDLAAEQLAGNDIRNILATANGDVWLGSAAGLERFHDGRWSANTTEPAPFPRYVEALVWAYESVWAGTLSGLARFDGQSWEPFGGPAPEYDGPMVSALAVAPSGELWVGTSEGANRLRTYDGQDWTVTPLPSSTMFVAQMVVTTAGQLVAVVYDEFQVLLGIYDGQTWTWHTGEALQLAPRWLGLAPDGRLWVSGYSLEGVTSPEEARSLLRAAPGQTSARAAVAVFELEDGGLGREVGRFAAPDLVAGSWYSSGMLTPIDFGPDGRVYVAGHEAVYVFDSGSDNVVPIETLSLPLPFSRFTFALEVALDGRLWVVTSAGVAVWDGQAWRSYYAPPRAPAWWGSVNTLLPRADGGTVLGTSGGGLGLYTGRGFTGLTNARERPAGWAASPPPIAALLYRDAGELWAATEGGGVMRLTETEWQVFTPDATLAGGNSALAATDGQLWLGTMAGRAAVEPVGDSCRFATVEAGEEVSDALRDGQGAVWLATRDDGVLRLGDDTQARREVTGDVRRMALSPNGEVWFADERQPWLLRYRPNGGNDAWSRLPFDQTLMDAASLTALAIGPDLDLWLGGMEGEHGGLVRFSSGRWSRLTTADGLADNWVLAVVVAPDGAVWVATYGGLSRFKP
jgi:ligand-binding sensor domain-containing protein